MRRPVRTRRRGYTLVFFAMFLFAFMALAALVIDIGFARLTQRQMQTAADAAALEGLRFRDEYPPGYSPPTSLKDARRQQVSDIVAWTFDDNFDPTDGDPVNFGAGPLVDFSGGAGEPSLVASQLMEVDPDYPVYKPQVLDGPSLATDSFQVALRRGTTDMPSDAHLYANGPAVPYLFARGSLINRQLIESGITVRGTATAEFRAAKSIGFAIEPDVPGLTSFALPTADGMIDASAPHFFTIDSSVAMPVAIGRELPDPSGLPGDGFTETGYAPVYAALSTGSMRIIGFVRASVSVVSGTATVTLAPEQKARDNASAVVCFATDGSVTAPEMTEIVGLNQSLSGVLQAVVLIGAIE